MKKYRSERKGRRSFDTALEYDTARMMVSEKTRTTKPVVRATLLGRNKTVRSVACGSIWHCKPD